MEYATQYPRFDRNRRTPRLTFPIRTFAVALGFLAFALIYVSVGIRWHTYRARASLYAQQEMESTFKAADYKRAARNPGLSDEASRRTIEYRRLAEMHTKAAEENGRLRKLYEEAW